MNETLGGSFARNADLRGSGSREAAQGNDFVLNLTEIMRLLRRGIWIIAACALLGGLFAVYSVLQVTPTYSATSQILLGQQSRADDALGNLFEGFDLDGGEIASQIAIMASGRILTRVSETLALSELPEFNAELRPKTEGPSLFERGVDVLKDGLKAVLGAGGEADPAQKIGSGTDGNAVNPISAAATAEIAALGDQADFVGGLKSGLRIRQVGKTPLVNISFTSPDRLVAAAVANTVADEYIAFQLEEKFGATRRITEGLNERIADLRLRLEAAERAVFTFRDQSLEGNVGGSERFEQQIRELSSRLVVVSAERAELEAELNQINSLIADQGELAVAGILQSDLVFQLQRERSELQQRLEQFRERFSNDSPRITEVVENLSRIESALSKEVERLQEELESKTSVAVAREASIRQQLRELERRYLTLSQEQVRLSQLEREAEASRLVYETFLTTFTQTSEVVGLQEADARVVSYASPPGAPTAPNKKVSVLLGLIAGTFAGIGLVFLRAFQNQSIDSIDKLRRQLVGVPVVATMPRIRGLFRRSNPLEAVAAGRDLPLMEAARTLRNTLMLKPTGPGWKVAIISAQPGDGKTTTSLLLAQAAVQAGKRSVVVDADLRRSSVARAIQMNPRPDLIDVLDGKVELSEALRKDESTGIHVLPAEPGVSDPAGLFLSQPMQGLIKTLEAQFDLIIFDTAPLLSVTDALPVLRYADDVVLVARWKRSSTVALRSCLNLLSEVGVPLTCAVMTMTRGREFRRSDSYYYTKGSGATP